MIPVAGGTHNEIRGGVHYGPVIQGRDITVHMASQVPFASLPVRVAALDYTSVLADAGVDQFTGREWLLDQICASFSASGDSGPGRYVLVMAPAGMGKTAFAAWLSREWACACHFTQSVTRGRDADVAMRSLAAQLVLRYGLEEPFAVGGMLAPWAGDPAYLPRVLDAAAERARQQSRPVRIVIDSLDEARGDGLALGLPHPQQLPDGVQIVATCREGTDPCQLPSGERVTWVRIKAEDANNREDIDRFLTARAAEQPVAARLAAAGILATEFTQTLAERCAGVWVYLRYVLARIQLGGWDRADLQRLPSGLVGYYRQQVAAHRAGPQFFSEDLPALATLAVAEQPVSLAQLNRLTGLEPGVLSVLCDRRYRPFLSVDSAHGTPRYAIYHASLREFLCGTPAAAEDARQDPVEDARLREEVHAAHQRIADHYLDACFGGLADGLPALRDDLDLAASEDSYPLRHLPAHLDHAGRHDDLHALLTCRKPITGASLGTVWADAHEHAGTLGDYLAAIDLARRHAERGTDRQIAAGQIATSLAAETHYALLAALVVSRSYAVPRDLLEALVSTGVWSIARALSHAYQVQHPARRAELLTAVLPHIRDADRAAQAAADALDAAIIIDDEWTQEKVLTDMAPHLDDTSLERAVQVAAAMHKNSPRARTLAAAGSRLAGLARVHALDQALDAAAQCRAAVMSDVAPYLDQSQLGRALQATLQIPVDADRNGERARALADIVLHLPAATGRFPLEKHVLGTHTEEERWVLLSGLVPHMDGPARTQAIDHIFDHIMKILNYSYIKYEYKWCIRTTIKRLMPYLESAAHLNRALDAVAPPGGVAQVAVLDMLLPHLSTPPLRLRALQITLAIKVGQGTDIGSRIRLLAKVASHLEGPAREQAIGEALQCAALIENGTERAAALAHVALSMEEPDKTSTLDEALRTAVSPQAADREKRASTLHRLSGYLEGNPAPSDSLIVNPLGERTTNVSNGPQTWAMAAEASRLHGSARDSILQQVLHAARSIQDPVQRAWNLAGVAPHLYGPLRGRVLDQALDAVTSTGHEGAVAVILDAVAPFLPADRLPRAMRCADSLGNPEFRVRALVSLAGYAPAQARPQAVSEALCAVSSLSGTIRAHALARLMTPLDGALFARVLAVALGLPPHMRAETMADAAPYLDPAQIQQVAEHVLVLPLDGSYTREIDRAHAALFARIAQLATGEERISAEDAVSLLRRFHHKRPPLAILFPVVGVFAAATARIGGRETVRRQHELIERSF